MFFYGEIRKNIAKLSRNTLYICSTGILNLQKNDAILICIFTPTEYCGKQPNKTYRQSYIIYVVLSERNYVLKIQT